MRSLVRSCNGNIAVLFALLLPLILGFVGAGIDYTRYTKFQAQLEAVADAAAISGAREFLILKSAKQTAKKRAEYEAEARLADITGLQEIRSKASADHKAATVTVEISTAF